MSISRHTSLEGFHISFRKVLLLILVCAVAIGHVRRLLPELRIFLGILLCLYFILRICPYRVLCITGCVWVLYAGIYLYGPNGKRVLGIRRTPHDARTPEFVGAAQKWFDDKSSPITRLLGFGRAQSPIFLHVSAVIFLAWLFSWYNHRLGQRRRIAKWL